jgi:hypothetical protein
VSGQLEWSPGAHNETLQQPKRKSIKAANLKSNEGLSNSRHLLMFHTSLLCVEGHHRDIPAKMANLGFLRSRRPSISIATTFANDPYEFVARDQLSVFVENFCQGRLRLRCDCDYAIMRGDCILN